VTPPTLREWLHEEPFALTMSAGFFGFFAHAGALAALEDAKLTPSRASGASAGALVTGVWSAGVDGDTLARELLALRREDFWDPAVGFGLLRGGLFLERLRAMLPARTFAECRVPFAVSAFDLVSRRVRSIDRGDVALAITASCALPGLFHPVWIDGRPLIDGGVTDRPGLAGMPEGARVLYHHLGSKSPWRRRSSPALRVPTRANMRSVVLDGLPRVGPFRLREGVRAFEAARRGMGAALDRRPEGAVVVITPSV
jgi:NTE family protein